MRNLSTNSVPNNDDRYASEQRGEPVQDPDRLALRQAFREQRVVDVSLIGLRDRDPKSEPPNDYLNRVENRHAENKQGDDERERGSVLQRTDDRQTG